VKVRSALGTWVRAALTLGILWYLVSRIDLGEAWRALVRLRLDAAVLVLVLLAVDRAVMIGRWILLLRARQTPVSARSAAWIYLVSAFAGSALPAGVGADLLRAYSLGRRTAAGAHALASVAVDRVLGMLSIAALGLAGVWLWTGPAASDLGLRAASASLVVAGACAVLFWADRVVRLLLPAAWRLGAPGRRLLTWTDALGAYRAHRGTLLVVFALSLIVQVLRVLEAYVLGRGLGIPVPFGYYLVFMPVGLLMLLLPVSISGFGLPQGVIVWMLRPQGVPDAHAFALSTLIVLSGLVGNLPGAWLYLRASRG
jgi:uncharacterized membrane protein YbhN (UPF0104 family)